MSGLAPLFTTAPRLKLYIYDQPVAYAVGFNISISVDVQPVYVIGQYAPVSLEPTMYNIVSGTMQIVRLVSQTTQTALNSSAESQKQLTNQASKRATADFANIDAAGEATSAVGLSNSPLQQSELFKHLDPAQLLKTQSFNVRIFMKVPKIESGAFVNSSSGPQSNQNLTNGLEEKEWFEIQGCRITSRNTNITMSQLVNEPVSFQGLLATHTSSDSVKFKLDSAINQKAVTGS